MASNEKGVSMRYVTDLGKNGRPYYAVELSFPTQLGGTIVKMVFLKDLELQLLGLDVSRDFVKRK